MKPTEVYYDDMVKSNKSNEELGYDDMVALTESNKSKINFAQRINDYRIFPRLLLLGVSYVVYHSLEKFWQLDSPSTEQTAVVGIVVGIIPAVIAFYQSSGKK